MKGKQKKNVQDARQVLTESSAYMFSWKVQDLVSDIRQLKTIYAIQREGALSSLKKLAECLKKLNDLRPDTSPFTEDEFAEIGAANLIEERELYGLRKALNDGLQDLQEIFQLDKELRKMINGKPVLFSVSLPTRFYDGQAVVE